MGHYIDFEAVKAANPIDQVAKSFTDIDWKERNNQLRAACPSGEGGDRALCVTPSKGKFYCFGCKEGGDAIQLVAHLQGVDVKTAAQYLAGPETSSHEDRSRREKPAKGQGQGAERGFRPLDYLDPEHDAVEAVGLTPLDASEIGCGYAPRGAGRGSVMIPIRLTCGTCIGYLGVQELTFVPKEWKYPK